MSRLNDAQVAFVMQIYAMGNSFSVGAFPSNTGFARMAVRDGTLGFMMSTRPSLNGDPQSADIDMRRDDSSEAVQDVINAADEYQYYDASGDLLEVGHIFVNDSVVGRSHDRERGLARACISIRREALLPLTLSFLLFAGPAESQSVYHFGDPFCLNLTSIALDISNPETISDVSELVSALPQEARKKIRRVVANRSATKSHPALAINPLLPAIALFLQDANCQAPCEGFAVVRSHPNVAVRFEYGSIMTLSPTVLDAKTQRGDAWSLRNPQTGVTTSFVATRYARDGAVASIRTVVWGPSDRDAVDEALRGDVVMCAREEIAK